LRFPMESRSTLLSIGIDSKLLFPLLFASSDPVGVSYRYDRTAAIAFTIRFGYYDTD